MKLLINTIILFAEDLKCPGHRSCESRQESSISQGSRSGQSHSRSHGDSPHPGDILKDNLIEGKMRTLSLGEIEIEKMPYRSRTAVYSPTFIGLSSKYISVYLLYRNRAGLFG